MQTQDKEEVKEWISYVDRSPNKEGHGVGLILIGLNG